MLIPALVNYVGSEAFADHFHKTQTAKTQNRTTGPKQVKSTYPTLKLQRFPSRKEAPKSLQTKGMPIPLP